MEWRNLKMHKKTGRKASVYAAKYLGITPDQLYGISANKIIEIINVLAGSVLTQVETKSTNKIKK